jgi:hypothetical protein
VGGFEVAPKPSERATVNTRFGQPDVHSADVELAGLNRAVLPD